MQKLSEIFDRLDSRLCGKGILPSATWSRALRQRRPMLYAGGLYRYCPQFRTHFGISHLAASTRTIPHDLRHPLPIGDNTIELFQSEDVFEHIPYAELPAVINEVFRVLKPGGHFRLSVPDYRCPILLDRTIKNDVDAPVFDPGGGGAFVNGEVVDGGHLWFPVYETVKALLENTRFAAGGTIEFLHYTLEDGQSVLNTIDYSLGHVARTPDHDARVMSPRRAMSVVVDARKNPAV